MIGLLWKKPLKVFQLKISGSNTKILLEDDRGLSIGVSKKKVDGHYNLKIGSSGNEGTTYSIIMATG